MEIAALVGSSLVVVLAVFQLALAAGAPWGAAAYGGIHRGTLPNGLRINGLVFGAVIHPIVALYLLDAGGIVASAWLPGSRTIVLWGLAAFFALGTLANFASRSRVERWWGPLTLALTVCCVIIARG